MMKLFEIRQVIYFCKKLLGNLFFGDAVDIDINEKPKNQLTTKFEEKVGFEGIAMMFLMIFFYAKANASSILGASNQGLVRDFVESDLNKGNEIRSDYRYDNSKDFENKSITSLTYGRNSLSGDKDNIAKSSIDSRFFSLLNLPKSLFIYTNLQLNEMNSKSEYNAQQQLTQTKKNQYFENTGLSLDEISLGIKKDNYLIHAGKLRINFGNAWRFDRGIWPGNVTNSYQEWEKIGIVSSYKLGDITKTGQYVLGLSIFKNDEKYLDNSLFSRRDRIVNGQFVDKVAGDTSTPKSINLSLDVNFIFEEQERLSYHIAYSSLAIDRKSMNSNKNLSNQESSVFSMNYIYPISSHISIDGLLEYADIKNVSGFSDTSNHYLTASVIARIEKNWNLTINNSTLNNKVFNQSTTNLRQTEISAGYDFKLKDIIDRITLQAGYKINRITQDKMANIVGINSGNEVGVMCRIYKTF